MKTKSIYLTALFLLFFCLNANAQKRTRIKGNGKIITQQINIEEYDKIDAAGQLQLEYEQKPGKVYFEITIDENILPYLEIKVKSGTLNIAQDRSGKSQKNVDIQPTVYKVRTNSPKLKEASFAGSGNYSLRNIKNSQKVKISMAGSGSTDLYAFNADGLHMEVAGSGSVNGENITVKTVKGDLAGSGNIKLSGRAETIKFSLAGSGKIQADNLVVKEGKVDVAGSGNIYISVADKLKASVAGSGNIYYKGSPSLEHGVAGSGKIRSMN